MMSDDTYNGWKNYETWAMNLWLTNDEYLAGQVEMMGREALEDAVEYPGRIWTSLYPEGNEARDCQARYTLAEALRDEMRDTMPDLGASVWADLLSAAFGEVDWAEIADATLAGIVEADAQ